MDQPDTLASALEALNAARADVQALEILAAEHATTLNALNALTETHNDLQASLAAASLTCADQAALIAKLEAEKQTAAERANAIVANVGVEPVAITLETSGSVRTKSELWAEYQTLGFNERNDFYKKNKAQMAK
jgi:ABC-type nitrate/sulfonate/bicarbonate transport system substrate-binding protein